MSELIVLCVPYPPKNRGQQKVSESDIPQLPSRLLSHVSGPAAGREREPAACSGNVRNSLRSYPCQPTITGGMRLRAPRR